MKSLSNGAFLINLHTLQHVTGINVVVSKPWSILSFISQRFHSFNRLNSNELHIVDKIGSMWNNPAHISRSYNNFLQHHCHCYYQACYTKMLSMAKKLKDELHKYGIAITAVQEIR